MPDSLLVLYVVYFISIILYILAAITTAAFVIPLQLREAKVKNGLATLRKQLLMKGVLSLVIALVSILALTSRYTVGTSEMARYITVVFVLVVSLGTFLKSIIDYLIYHSQYTPENKEFHEKVHKLEEKAHSRERGGKSRKE